MSEAASARSETRWPAKHLLAPLDLSDRDELIIFEVCSADETIVAVQLAKYPLPLLERLNERLTNELYPTSVLTSDATLELGDLVAVEIEGALYRGWVCELNDPMCSVYQVDFGAVCEVPLHSLRRLPSRYASYPQMGLRCRLAPNQLWLLDREESFKATNFRLSGDQGPGGVTLLEFDLDEGLVDTQTAEKCSDVSSARQHHDKAVTAECVGATALVQIEARRPSGDEDVAAFGDGTVEQNGAADTQADADLIQAESAAAETDLVTCSDVDDPLSTNFSVWFDALVLEIHPRSCESREVRATVQLISHLDDVLAVIGELVEDGLIQLHVAESDGTSICGLAFVDIFDKRPGCRPGGQWVRVYGEKHSQPASEGLFRVELTDYGLHMTLPQGRIFHCPDELAVLPAACAKVCWPASDSKDAAPCEIVTLRARNVESTDDFALVDIAFSNDTH